jgi:hypothetical protein
MKDGPQTITKEEIRNRKQIMTGLVGIPLVELIESEAKTSKVETRTVFTTREDRDCLQAYMSTIV